MPSVCVCVGVVSVCAKCVMMQVSPGYWGMKMQTRLLKQRKKRGAGSVYETGGDTHH